MAHSVGSQAFPNCAKYVFLTLTFLRLSHRRKVSESQWTEAGLHPRPCLAVAQCGVTEVVWCTHRGTQDRVLSLQVGKGSVLALELRLKAE